MEAKKFTKFEIAAMKRTAANVDRFISQKERLNAKKAAIEAELASVQQQIDLADAPTIAITGGYGTEAIIRKEVIDTGKKDAKGNPVKTIKYVLKYPETVIPVPVEELPANAAEHEGAISCGCATAEAATTEEAPATFTEEDAAKIPFMGE